MKYAIISDIHSNLEALSSVLLHIKQQNVDKIYCCGDLVGYFSSPNECIQLLGKHNVISIAGNHDLAAAGIKEDLSSFWEVAYKAILWTRKALTPDSLKTLRDLPRTLLVDNKFLLFHGALHVEKNPEDLHLTKEKDIRLTMQALTRHESGIKLGFFGHSHQDIVYRFYNGQIETISEKDFSLEPDSWYMINPGSVGQPRDGDPRLSYLTYDDASDQIHFFRLEYDVRKCIRKAALAGIWQPRWMRRIFQYSTRIRNRLHRIIFGTRN